MPGAFRSPQRASLSLFCAVTLHGPPSISPHFTTLTTNNTPPPVERKKEKFFPPPTSLSFTILATDWSLLRSQAVAWDPLFFPRRCSGATLRVKKILPVHDKRDRRDENVYDFPRTSLCGPVCSWSKNTSIGGRLGGLGGLAKRIPLQEAHMCNFCSNSQRVIITDPVPFNHCDNWLAVV